MTAYRSRLAVHSRTPNGSAVILLHGVADTRAGMMGPARFLLERGYTVLAPDSRGHGTSGGGLITYGIKKRATCAIGPAGSASGPASSGSTAWGHRWAAPSCSNPCRANRAFGPWWRIVRSRRSGKSRDRLHKLSGRAASRDSADRGSGDCVCALGIQHRFGPASPAPSAPPGFPILLIHGDRDANIPLRHSRELRSLNPAIQLWEVPGAGHVASFIAAPEEYAHRVLDWFATHP